MRLKVFLVIFSFIVFTSSVFAQTYPECKPGFYTWPSGCVLKSLTSSCGSAYLCQKVTEGIFIYCCDPSAIPTVLPSQPPATANPPVSQPTTSNPLRPNPFDLVPEESQKQFYTSKDEMTVGVAESPEFNLPIGAITADFRRFITPFLSLGQGGSGGFISPPGTTNVFQCDNENAPKPQAVNIKFSTDGKYAFPLAPVMDYGCYHWNNVLAADIFTGNSSASDPPKNLPVIAYTSGEIIYKSENDVSGGKNLILKGSDGRAYYYAHNCAVFVNIGSHVNVGDVIATTNQTGLLAQITPEHLHFAMIEGAGPNPYFQNGGGNICPQTDFEQKFKLGACTPSQQCALIP